MRISDWSPDVCSSDLGVEVAPHRHVGLGGDLGRPVLRRFQRVLLLAQRRAVDVESRLGQQVGGGRDNRVVRVHRLLQRIEAALAQVGERSEEHTSELQSLMRISYAVFCLKKKKKTYHRDNTTTR